MTISTEQAQRLTAGTAEVRTRTGKVGRAGQVYLDDTTGEPSWVTVKTGLFGTKETFVPLRDATLDGDDVVVDYDEDTIKNAPKIDPDGSLSPQEEDELYAYYGHDTHTATDLADSTAARDTAATGPTAGYTDSNRGGYSDTGSDTVSTRGGDSGTSTGEHHTAEDAPIDADDPTETGDDRADRVGEAGVVGQDRSGPTTDDAMTRSEERLNVGTQTREAGRARLRKFVTTETVTQTVPVSHEEVTVHREPITDANAAAAGSGPAISEEEHEVVLHEEVPVVDKDVVAVERVRLDTETVSEQATVSDDVRKEQIEMVDPDDPSTPQR